MNQPARPTAYVNGRIYTVDASRPWVDAIFVQDGKIADIGTSVDILAAAGSDCAVVDLAGRMIMPGIHDAHGHILLAGLKHRYECRLPADALGRDYGERLCDCIACSRGKLSGWVIGGDFNPTLSAPGEVDRKYLDEKFPDTPVYLHDYSLHHGLANSKALELAGITADTPDPFGGRIVRRAGSNEPTGELVERATWQLFNAMPSPEPDVHQAALRWALETASRFGVTGIQEASASRPELEMLQKIDQEQGLTLRVYAHIPWREEHFGHATSEALERLIEERRRFASERLSTDFVKVFMDGSPLGPHFTDAQLDPLTGQPQPGKLLHSREDLAAALIAWDKAGITAKIHCTGDAAVQLVLQAMGDMRAASHEGTIQEISHCCFVQPDDLASFAELNVTAEMSPPIWFGDMPELAPFRERGYPFGTLARMGARVTVGTDWTFLPEPNLFPALQGLLQHGAESVDLATGIEMLTLSGARAVGAEDKAGSISPGKSADFIILDRDLFAIPVDEISETRVLTTIFEGRILHDVR
ncbi:amidohydrolase [Sphingobium sp. BS19]|uniref:amidohydrolase n=1 Tax=Sphingobium sp. BS19 TaxID=3018973 RepID=UPI0022EEA1B7|nr:amidohydrolase [Sphingobium sp. BS19]GLI98477.1 amidohydrolase [Sphingobium sp. BS19]|tara:strand:- start:42755 stop:44344 length:1590 start_codon:yes stop_codon:yes gene_type:complete